MEYTNQEINILYGHLTIIKDNMLPFRCLFFFYIILLYHWCITMHLSLSLYFYTRTSTSICVPLSLLYCSGANKLIIDRSFKILYANSCFVLKRLICDALTFLSKVLNSTNLKRIEKSKFWNVLPATAANRARLIYSMGR